MPRFISRGSATPVDDFKDIDSEEWARRSSIMVASFVMGDRVVIDCIDGVWLLSMEPAHVGQRTFRMTPDGNYFCHNGNSNFLGCDCANIQTHGGMHSIE
jgi:hypothetical protein